VYNILHTASTPGPADAFRPRTPKRLFRRRRAAIPDRGQPRVEPARPAGGGAPPEPTAKGA
jgi:hypothetical protein